MDTAERIFEGRYNFRRQEISQRAKCTVGMRKFRLAFFIQMFRFNVFLIMRIFKCEFCHILPWGTTSLKVEKPFCMLPTAVNHKKSKGRRSRDDGEVFVDRSEKRLVVLARIA
jgi:hypothetical protein